MNTNQQESPWSVTRASLSDIQLLCNFHQLVFADVVHSETDVLNLTYSDGPLPETALAEIISSEECVLIWLHNDVVGFVLLDEYSNTPYRKQQLKLLQYLFDEGLIDPEWRVASRFSEGWLPSLPPEHVKALQQYAMNGLLQLTHEKYDAWLYGCRGDASQLQKHLNNGWQIG